jgi:hypothetical protein
MTESYVAILEDDSRRCDAMRRCLALILPEATPVVFDSGLMMVDWLNRNQAETSLMSLDHDLPMRRESDDQVIDHGTGRVVADYLGSKTATCPVLVHSSNEIGASDMMSDLHRNGWLACRVHPSDDLQWISTSWIQAIRHLMKRGLVSAAQANQEVAP